MKKIFRQIHLWLAVPVGLVFCMSCLTGAVLVWEDEITDAVYAGSRVITAPAGVTPMSEEQLTETLAPHLDKGVKVKAVEPSASPDQAWRVTLSKPKGAALFVNQYDGSIVAEAGRLPFFSWVRSLHRWLLDAPRDGGSAGRTIVGWCTVAALLIVLSGIVLWWPRTSRALRSAVTINGTNIFTFWRSLHVAGGFWAAIILLLLILTGLTWSFAPYRDWVVGVFGDLPFKAIHTGSFLGWVSKTVWMLAALTGAALPLTGYYLWIKRLRRNGRRNS